MNHFDVAGKRIPAAGAPESELFALADVLREVGTGVIQCRRVDEPILGDAGGLARKAIARRFPGNSPRVTSTIPLSRSRAEELAMRALREGRNLMDVLQEWAEAVTGERGFWEMVLNVAVFAFALRVIWSWRRQ
jgi:hypothetical protein